MESGRKYKVYLKKVMALGKLRKQKNHNSPIARTRIVVEVGVMAKKIDVLVTFLMVVTKYLRRSNAREKGNALACGLRIQTMVWER